MNVPTQPDRPGDAAPDDARGAAPAARGRAARWTPRSRHATRVAGSCDEHPRPLAAELFVPVVAVVLHARTAPLAVRERAAFAPGRGAAAHVMARLAAQSGADGVFVLSTCNRVELYAAAAPAARAATAASLLSLLADRCGVDVERMRALAGVYVGVDAVRHLCSVAAGLDSVVLGETQITGQLRRALVDAREDGVLGPVLHRLGSTALAAGRRARPLARVTTVGAPRSIVDAALRAIGGGAALRGRSVAVLGAGATARDVVALVARAGVAGVTVVNRSDAHGAALARRFGAGHAPWAALDEAVRHSDVVFACTAAAAPVVLPEHVRGRHGPAARPVVVVDLGVPRNVAAGVATLSGVTVWDLEQLDAPEPAADDHDADASAAADAEVERWTARFTRWVRAREVVPTIAGLRAAAEAACEQEVARALARLGGLDARGQAVVRALGARLVNKMLHAPIAALADDPRLHGDPARRLFGLDGFSPELDDSMPGDENAPSALADDRSARPLRPRVARRALAS